MKEFADLRDAGRKLADSIRQEIDVSPGDGLVVIAVLPNGVPVSLGVRDSLDLPDALPVRVLGLPIVRSDDGAVVADDVADLARAIGGRTAIVVDDGVETGTVARAVAGPLRAASPKRLVLAVPVCPREAMADLQHRYDDIVAVSTPLVRRDLGWHYRDFDRIDDAEALRLLADT